jgi:hypothetical protein
MRSSACLPTLSCDQEKAMYDLKFREQKEGSVSMRILADQADVF